MKAVWKYPLPPHPGLGVWIQKFEMPAGARPLSAQLQARDGMTRPAGWPTPTALTIWAEVDPYEQFMQTRGIAVVGTGHEVPPDARFVSTVQDGPFVWHVFDLGEVAS